ncbi:ABC transporter ATP-binding protein [uncultured Jatrophihabitans sp.]|uniref:ABC transporter ATP-binding protein n=1 Tax=uncultured Jatrophihabitans sp. TaxID=1610747 RepID=UPI0035CAE6EF
MNNSDLIVSNLSVNYGAHQALFDVSMTVPTGHTVAVLGANGAGKSTLGRALSRLVPISSGRVTFGEVKITEMPAHKIRQTGLAYIPEGRGIFPGISVHDNVKMAIRRMPRAERADALENVLEVFPALKPRLGQRAGSMSGGEQQMLAMGMALAASPRLIIADEMSLGLAPLMVNTMFASLQRARERGISIILIEQFIHRALAFADECVILSRGSVSWAGRTADAGEQVLRRYLGSDEVA